MWCRAPDFLREQKQITVASYLSAERTVSCMQTFEKYSTSCPSGLVFETHASNCRDARTHSGCHGPVSFRTSRGFMRAMTGPPVRHIPWKKRACAAGMLTGRGPSWPGRSEEHTSELQS